VKINKHKGPEEIIQQGFIEEVYKRYPIGTERELLITCSPAGFKMPKLMRIKFSQWAAKMGYRKGTPDVTILEPRGRYHGLFIEFKAPRGNTEPEQREFWAKAQKRGYAVAMCRSVNSAMETLEKYLREV
jgi:hypothetical protein